MSAIVLSPDVDVDDIVVQSKSLNFRGNFLCQIVCVPNVLAVNPVKQISNITMYQHL